MIGSRLALYGLSAVLIAVSAGALVDGISNRREIAVLERVVQQTAENLRVVNENLGTCHANYRLIELALDRQGADIRKLSDDTKAAGDRAASAAQRAAADSKAAREASQRVLARPLPTPDLACIEAAILLRGGM